MPSSSQRLRSKFMVNGSDGVAKCYCIVHKHGGTIDRGWIHGLPDGEWNDELSDAVQFLIEEWDYAYGPKPETRK